MHDNVIIGGGVTGLSLAYYLSKAKKKFTLFEPNKLGGFIQSEQIENSLIELGPNVLLYKNELKELIKDLGLEAQVTFPTSSKYKQFVWADDKATEVPKNLLKFLKTSLFPLPVKLKILKGLFASNILYTSEKELSVLDFLSPILGENYVRKIVDPALQGIYAGKIDNLSARSLFSGIWQASKERQSLFSYMNSKTKAKPAMLREGNETLTKTLVSKLPKENIVNKEIESIEYENNYFNLMMNGGGVVSAKKIFITTAGAVTLKFIKQIDTNISREIKNINYAPLLVVHCLVSNKESIPKDSFGILFPSNMPSGMLGVMYNTCLFPHMNSANEELITVCLGGMHKPEVLNLANSEIGDLVEGELKDKLGISIKKVLKVTKWQNAIPQYELNHYLYEQELAKLELQYSGLFFCGADIGGVGVADRVSKAFEAYNKSC